MNEISHFRPLLAPLPLDGTVVTTDAMQANRDNSLFVRKVKKAHYLWPILGNQPKLNQTLNALPWETTPVAAATSEISRGRIETRTIRVLPAPEGTGFQDARQALLIERYVTYKKKGQWHTRAESVLYLTSLAADKTTPEDLLAHVRGHWRVEHAHWLRDVIWKEDKSLIRTGNGPQAWSAITNLVITLFRIHGVTSYTAETRRIARIPAAHSSSSTPQAFHRLNTARDFDESLVVAAVPPGPSRDGPRHPRLLGCHSPAPSVITFRNWNRRAFASQLLTARQHDHVLLHGIGSAGQYADPRQEITRPYLHVRDRGRRGATRRLGGDQVVPRRHPARVLQPVHLADRHRRGGGSAAGLPSGRQPGEH